MDSLRLDLHFALRSLRRRRAFSAVAIITVALSIGAASSIYSVVDAVLLRPLPYKDPSHLVAVWETIPSWRKEPILAVMWDRVPVSYAAFVRWRARQTSFAEVGAWTGRSMTLSLGDQAEQVFGTRVSPSLLDVLGVKALLGRTFLPGEDVLNGPKVTILSYDAWQSRFGGRRDIIGRTVLFDSVPYQIVGVLPSSFMLGSPITGPLSRGMSPTPFFTPAGQDSNDLATAQNHSYRTIGRLRPHVSLARATAEANWLLAGAEERPARGIRILEYQLDETRDVRAPLLLLLSAVALLVLIACLNVATLLLGEAALREQEIGTRVALGATRARLVAQLLTETLLLAFAGSALGAALSWWMTKGLVAIAPSRIPGIQAARVDARVLAVTAAAATITGVLFGLGPALTLSRSGRAMALRSRSQNPSGRGRLQRILIATELALSVVMLTGAGLVSRSLAKLSAVNPGFRAANLVMLRLAIPRALAHDDEAIRSRYNAMLRRLPAVPGVAAVTGGSPAPFDGNSSSTTILKETEATPLSNTPAREVQQRVVLSNFFSVLGIPVLAGRAFTADDRPDAPLVAVASEALARRDWPNESPIGQKVKFQGKMWTIVGVVGDTKVNELSAADRPTLYTPFDQRAALLVLLVRTHGNPAALVPSLRAALREAEPSMPVGAAYTMESRIGDSYHEERFRTLLIDVFAIVAGVLAAVGMYGVTYRAVSRRTREVGIRVALGASASSVMRMIVGSALAGVGAGAAVGLLASLAGGRVLAPYLFGVSAHDPVTYAGIMLILALISLAASWAPARRAARVAPSQALRGE